VRKVLGVIYPVSVGAPGAAAATVSPNPTFAKEISNYFVPKKTKVSLPDRTFVKD